MVDYKDLGHRVRTLRRMRDLTQEELAEKLDISASFLGHIERGTRVASLETLVALCNALKVSPQELLIASLDENLNAHLPADLNEQERAQLSAFLRMTCDLLDHWGNPVNNE